MRRPGCPSSVVIVLTRVSAFCFRSRRLVTAVWVTGLIALAALAVVAAGKTSDAYTVPGSGSQHALHLLRAHGLGDDQTGSMRVVFRDRRGLRIPAVRAAVESTLTRVRDRLPGARVIGPFDPAGHDQVSSDATVAYAQVELRHPDGARFTDAQLSAVPDKLDQVEHVATSAPGLQTAFAGSMFETTKGAVRVRASASSPPR